jgi:hypothetical protein
MTRTRQIVQHHGGLQNCDIAMVPHLLNWMPMAPIGCSGALEQMRGLAAKIRKEGGYLGRPMTRSLLAPFRL